MVAATGRGVVAMTGLGVTAETIGAGVTIAAGGAAAEGMGALE